MAGIKSGSSGVGNDRSANCATTTALFINTYLVNSEPVDGGLQKTGHVNLNVRDVGQFLGQRVGHINGDHLPVCFPCVRNPKERIL